MNRYYDSQQGRFLQLEPLGLAAADFGDPQSLNLYAYIRNDPVNATDPLGLYSHCFRPEGSEPGVQICVEILPQYETVVIGHRDRGIPTSVSLPDKALGERAGEASSERAGGASDSPSPKPFNPEIFGWCSIETEPHSRSGGAVPGGPDAVAEAVFLTGWNGTGPFFGAIGATGYEVKATPAIYGAIYGGLKVLTQVSMSTGNRTSTIDQ